MSKAMFLSFFLVTSVSHAAPKCYKNISAQHRELNKLKDQKYSYCVEPDLNSLVSLECLKKKKCEATKARYFTSAMSGGFGAYGNPVVSTCEVAGGRARIIEFTAGPHKNKKITLCEFPDKSYMNLTGWVIKYVHYGITK